MTQQEINELQVKALEQFKSGKPLFGEGGAFAPMLKGFLEAALEAEMDAHLDPVERDGGNKRNGRGAKTIKSSEGRAFRLRLPKIVKVRSSPRSSKSGRPFWPITWPIKLLVSTD